MEKVGVIVGALALIIVVSFVFALPLMMLWNSCLVPAIPAIKEVTWLQMWGIQILIGFLFKTHTKSEI